MNNVVWNRQKLADIISYLIKIIVSFVAITEMSFEMWEPYAVPKNRYFYLGVIWFLILIFIVRKISYRDVEVWITLLVGFAFKYFYFKANNLNQEYYGEIYSKVISYTFTMGILFVALMVNSIRQKKIISTIKENWILLCLYTLVAVVTAFVFYESIATLIIPMYALIFSKLDEDELSSTHDCVSISMYLSFVFLIAKSLIYFPDVYEAGRYMGGFCSVENIGMFCGGAVISCMHFFIKWLHAAKRKWHFLLVLVPMVLFPCYVISKTDSRSALVGIMLAAVATFAFVRKEKNLRLTVLRISLSIFVCIFSIILLFAAGRYMTKGLQQGKFTSEELGYTLSHIQVLGDEAYRRGYFGDDSILNAINRFSADRLIIYAETVKQIEWKGHEFRVEPPYNIATPHNFFIMRLINMGIVPGGILCLWIAFFAIKECALCTRGVKSAIFPLLWTMYSIAVLSFTITKWNSLLPFMMFFLSTSIFVKDRAKEET